MVQAKKLGSRAVLADLTISKWLGTVTDREASNELADAKGAERDRVKVVKRLFTNLRGITSVLDTMYNEYKHCTAAWEEGRRLLAVDKFEHLTKIERECSDKLEKALDEAKDRWADMLNEAKEGLVGLNREDQFITFSEFRSKFRIKLNFFPIPEKGHFIVESEKKLVDEMTRNFDEAIKEKQLLATDDVKSRIAKAVKELVERLSGENMKFSFSHEVMDSIRSMVEMLPSLNLFDDPEINEMIEELKVNLCEVTDRDLKHKGKKRVILGKAKAMLDKMAAYAD